MPNSLGQKTRTIILDHESHKLHIEFTSTADYSQGQPFKLNANGTVTPYVKADNGVSVIIGYAIFGSGKANESVTLAVRGFVVVNVYAFAAQNAGPAKIEDHFTDSVTGENYDRYAVATISNMEGWALDQSAAQNDLIRFLIRG